MEPDKTKSVLVHITGRVQGVFFRAWTVQEARARGLSGWVRNRRDGSVEALFSGPEADVESMLTACRDGPPMAAVTDVRTEAALTPGDIGFDQRATA